MPARSRLPAAKANWLTDGADVQRSGWQRNETTLTPENVRNLKIVWKLQLDNVPREMHSLLPPLIVGEIAHRVRPEGNRDCRGLVRQHLRDRRRRGTDSVEKTFRVSAARTSRRAGDALCPGGQTATPVIGPPDAVGPAHDLCARRQRRAAPAERR
jgi:hypothetical protein